MVEADKTICEYYSYGFCMFNEKTGNRELVPDLAREDYPGEYSCLSTLFPPSKRFLKQQELCKQWVPGEEKPVVPLSLVPFLVLACSPLVPRTISSNTLMNK